MAFLELRGLTKSYGQGADAHIVLKDIDLAIEEGEFVAIVGFSGSGKTTLISAIAGLEAPDSGEVRLRGQLIDGPGPERGVVFQNYSLMPWLTAEGNVRLAVEAVRKDLKGKDKARHIARYIDMVGLTAASERRPAELSGGMRQRVAVARALSTCPEVLLLDEPLSALDALTRSKLQDEIEAIWEREKRTVVMITNDVDEAILLADRVIPLTPGPEAHLGPEFVVDIPRPRDRAEMNHDPVFRDLRARITGYLMEIGRDRGAEIDESLILPAVLPNTANAADVMPNAVPDAVKEAAAPKSGATDRYLEFTRLTKVYPTPKGPLTVVDAIDLQMKKGEFVTLIGHSGCGKSTVLSMVAGLNEVTSGGVILDSREVTTAGPDRGVVFQAPSLFPWLTARENVALGVDQVYPHATPKEREDIVRYYMTRVGLGDALDRMASDLSNGMKQRVGIARAFALSPKLLLLDEPFGMLDSLTRWDLQEVLLEVWTRTRVTAICVTHDVDEAILLADRVVMMTNGPNAVIGNIMEVDLPRPRSRKALLESPKYYAYREELLGFLKEYEGGARPARKPGGALASAAA